MKHRGLEQDSSVLYGVVDLARAPELREHVARLEPASAVCLFEGRLALRLRQVSPHLVELAAHDPLTRAWRSAGWGKSWGILLTSRAPLPVVRRRLRHFTQARLPDGRGPVLFRFWDPRVFRVYLPLVEPSAIAAWFTAIDRYVLETEDGSGTLYYALRDGSLHIELGAHPMD